MAEKPMRAILIDPKDGTITEVDHNGNFRDIYAKLTCDYMKPPCDDFNAVTLSDDGLRREVLWVDGEGLLKKPEHFIIVRGYPQPLAGRGLILGTDGGGDTVATQMTLDAVRELVTFKRLRYEGSITETGKTTLLGEPANFMRQTPVFQEREEET